MSAINDGGPAFPPQVVRDGDGCLQEVASYGMQSGMTLRDYFAAKAMEGDWSSQGDDNGVGVFSPEVPNATLDRSARLYYRMADAMLRTRKS